MSDLIDRQAAIDALHMHLMYRMGTDSNKKRLDEWINNLPSAQPETSMLTVKVAPDPEEIEKIVCKIKDTPVMVLPSDEPEIIRCKDCKFGEQDEVGRWFCRSLGCQIGNEDGSGYCADAERRTNERPD